MEQELVRSDEIKYEWSAGHLASDRLLIECSKLFSEHYGLWSANAPVSLGITPGIPVRLSSSKLRGYVSTKSSWIASARHQGRLVGYAFAVRAPLDNRGVVTWVTQLVVHTEFRNRKIATNILNSIWGFSDDFAWGLVTASPYAVRALESATRRRCHPREIAARAEDLMEAAASYVSYVSPAAVSVTQDHSIADTKFYVDHRDVPAMRKQVSGHVPWTLGNIEEGQEWLAFTFGTQEQFPLSETEFASLVREANKFLPRAYAGMRQDVPHNWAKHASAEIDVLINEMSLAPGSSVLDFGCGNGRHSLELAARGYKVHGVDFVEPWIENAREVAAERGFVDVVFSVDDCRSFFVSSTFDAGICLYDVVGSYADEADNAAILRSLSAPIKSGGLIALSVMNMIFTEAIALPEHKLSLKSGLEALQRLKPSDVMQNTGEVFDPEYYLIDTDTSIVYRKEQFSLPGAQLPVQTVVRDRRYTPETISELCSSVGLETVLCRPVRAGRWNEPLELDKAKELLLILRKP